RSIPSLRETRYLQRHEQGDELEWADVEGEGVAVVGDLRAVGVFLEDIDPRDGRDWPVERERGFAADAMLLVHADHDAVPVVCLLHRAEAECDTTVRDEWCLRPRIRCDRNGDQ